MSADAYPLPVYNYRVTVDKSETMSFTEVSGLEIDHDHILYRHGFSFAMGDHLLRGQRKPINVSLKRGVSKQRDYLFDWIEKGNKRDVTIELCDENGSALVTWAVIRALPFKLDAPNFRANSNDIAIESLSLIAHDLRLTYHE